MKDLYGREIDYLRISVTQRCNFNCAYCGAGQPDAQELSPAEFALFAGAFARAGIRKIRLTGGEPLIRSDITDIVYSVKKAAQPEILALTTNGYLLEQQANALFQAGINAVNISLDSLDKECFAQITGQDALSAVLRGVETALRTGFDRVKINAVLIRGENDSEAGALIALAKEYPLDVRFIELMPLEDLQQHKKQMVPAKEILNRFPELQPISGTEGTAAEYSSPGYCGRIGFISPVTNKFCKQCNRIRLLCNGTVKPCLGQNDVYDLRPFLNDPDRLFEEVCAVIRKKPAGHHFDVSGLAPMNTIGG